MAKKKGARLQTKVFPPETTTEDIFVWAKEFRSPKYSGCMLDQTVATALRKATGKFYGEGLNSNLRGHLKTSLGVEDTYKEVLGRVSQLVNPVAWVIVRDKITDYNPLDGEQTKEAYIEKFRTFLPADSQVLICDKAKDETQRNVSEDLLALGLKSSRVVVLCHHHAAPMCDYQHMYDVIGEGSLILETALDDLLYQVSSLVDLSDILAEGVIDQIREQLMAFSARLG